MKKYRVTYMLALYAYAGKEIEAKDGNEAWKIAEANIPSPDEFESEKPDRNEVEIIDVEELK